MRIEQAAHGTRVFKILKTSSTSFFPPPSARPDHIQSKLPNFTLSALQRGSPLYATPHSDAYKFHSPAASKRTVMKEQEEQRDSLIRCEFSSISPPHFRQTARLMDMGERVPLVEDCEEVGGVFNVQQVTKAIPIHVNLQWRIEKVGWGKGACAKECRTQAICNCPPSVRQPDVGDQARRRDNQQDDVLPSRSRRDVAGVDLPEWLPSRESQPSLLLPRPGDDGPRLGEIRLRLQLTAT